MPSLLLKQLSFFCYKKRFFLLIVSFFIHFNLLQAQNSISTENSNIGNFPSEWDITGAGDLNIQGFATDISINTGSTVDFKIDVKAPATNFTIKIYRIGYYNERGARLIADLGSFTGIAQPTPFYDVATGKTDCSNWSISASWTATGAVTGVYIAKLTRVDNGGSSHIAFIVRNDNSNSAILFKTSDATWQAYNGYGGNSLYVNNSGTAVPGYNHATKVSYNRPFITRNGGAGSSAAEDWFFHSEYPMVRWLERNGYDVSYTTDVDMERNTTPITTSAHKILLSVGHDEYWSAAERNKFETARNNGVHLAFFSGNEVYWKTRWEDSTRTLVCYKEGTLGENVCNTKCDPLNTIWTGLWRDGCAYTSADGCRPENALTGQISWQGSSGAITVSDNFKNLRFWRNTSVASLGSGQTATLAANTLGYEWDPESTNGAYPPGRILLSNTSLSGKTHKLSLYRHNSGALVFGAGTVQWSWGLDGEHDSGSSSEDARMQQATINLFADMGVIPATIQSGGFSSNSPTDITAPTSVIASPLNNAALTAGNNVTISGTSSDVGGVVALVEISVDGGTTWNVATGTTSWSYSWTPAVSGAVVIKSRAIDDNGNMEIPGTAPATNAINVNIAAGGPVACPCTIFQTSNTPSNPSANDGQPIELGMKFQSTLSGYITGVRFYKATGDNGTHIGHLWNNAGTLLSSATFTGETSSGWQQVNFASPVAITANTTYVISYHSSAGYYTYTQNYFSTAITNGSLKALADGEDGPNGVYLYTASPAYPNNTYQQSNYWVDVVFNTSIAPDVTPPVVSSVTPANNATSVSINSTVNAVFNEPLDPLTVSTATFELRNPSNALVTAVISYNTGTSTAILTPSSPLAYSTVYTATLIGGASDPRIKDVAGNAMATNYSWSFTTAAAPPPPPSEGPGGPILVISAAANPFSRYPVEILRAEGLNEFYAMDISAVTTPVLNNYDVVILGEMTLTAPNVTMLTNWVNAGGTLIAFKPDAQLAGLLGITPAGTTLSDKYLLVNTASGPGVGIVAQTIQFHGPADQYTLNGASSLATLYSTSATATTYPAVTKNNVGSNGGSAYTFTYDLARSIVYTRQGNPAWAGQSRDGQAGPIRSDNLFFGNSAGDPQPDYIDFSKIEIPQADEQQRLLTNIIIQSNLHRKPLPRFWFLPRKLKAAVVMTGDDHASGGTVGRFARYKAISEINNNNNPQDVLDWKAIRSTSYIYTSTSLSTISAAQALAFEADGFEVAAHISTNCGNWTSQSQLDNTFFTPQLAEFASKWPGVPAPSTNRTHCIAWSDWASQAKLQALKGIRLDDNYYYWPGSWIQNRAGMFTGSGMPMRFADLDGTLIDCYQVTTQMPDESGIIWPGFINTLLDNAIGTNGYYGVFCANMHTDNNNPGDQSVVGSEAIVAAAQARQIPVISARQMLTWLDARNASTFGAITWSGNTLSFSISVAANANKLQGMVPVSSPSGILNSLTLNGSPVSYTTEIIKGINYAFFDAATGNYVATYLNDVTPPVITNVVATPNLGNTATITWTTNEASNSSVSYGTSSGTLNLQTDSLSMVTSHSVTLSGLSSGATYYFRVSSTDAANNTATHPVAPSTLNFTMPSGPCASDITLADFNGGIVDANTLVIQDEDGAVSLKPTMNEEFSGAGVPSGWTDAAWGGGGISTFSGGQVTVNGSHVSYNTSFGPGTSLEFVATFTNGDFQNIGFTGDADFNNPWIVIGRGAGAGNDIYARTSGNQSSSLGSTLLNAPHRYRIQWVSGTNTFLFYVDGVLISTPSITQAVGTNMIFQISDYPAGGVGLTTDWIRASPYSTPGTFTSRVFDAGSIVSWGQVNWNEDVPANTSLSISIRKGNTAIPDGTWSAFTPVANAGIVGCSPARYIQYKADFTTTSNNLTPKLKDISIACNGVAPDLTPPVISAVVATPNSNGTSVITWTTDEASSSVINYGTISNNLNLNSNNASLVTNHSITLNGLVPGTTYYYQPVSVDCSNNSSSGAIASFTIPTPVSVCFQDLTTTDFTGGVTGANTFISSKNGGEVILMPTIAEDFNGTGLPSDWQSFAWTGGTSTVSGGSVSVDGARLNTVPSTTTYGPGTSLEFVATFGAAAFQHIGFGGGSDATGSGGIYNGENPWAMFSTGNQSSVLRARVFTGSNSFDVDLAGAFLGSSHLYRLEWNTSSFEFYIDGVLKHSQSATISSGMRPAVSDYNNGGAVILVDWIHVSPFAATGTFTSRVYDAGTVKSWAAANWTSDLPVGTTLQLSQRQSNFSTAIESEPWTMIASSGSTVGGASQYIQYKADFTTTNTALSAVLKDISISCTNAPNMLPVVNREPVSQIKCEGETVTFISYAAGNPVPSVQWQISTNNGSSWSDIPSATNPSLSFTTGAAHNGNLIRGIWANSVGHDTSATISLTVNAIGTWFGVNTNWSDPLNWCGGVPGPSTNITIPSGTVNMPVLPGNITINDLNLQTNTTLSINGNTLTINGAVSGNGTIIGSNISNLIIGGTGALGTINFNQTTDGTTNALNNLTINRSPGGTLTLGNKLVLLGLYSPTAGVLTTGGNLHLRSTATSTAMIGIGASGGGYINGNVTVERYTNDKRAWRLLAAPTIGQTIKQAWMENAATATSNPNPDFGTHITTFYGDPNAANYDAEKPSSSIRTFVGNSWSSTPNTTTPISNNQGYMLFVRGNRTIDLNDGTAHSSATLRSTGALKQGTQSAINIPYSATDYTLVGNPFASPIDYEYLFNNSSNLASTFYLWDANLAGTYGVGGYRLVERSAANIYQQTPAGGSLAVNNSLRYIHSGQAFLVNAASAGNASLIISESAKSTQASTIFPFTPTTIDEEMTVNLSSVETNLSVNLADGIRVKYNTGYFSNVTEEDIRKLNNFNENLGINRNGQTLILEKRPVIGATDTLYLKLGNMRIKNYRLDINGISLNHPNLLGKLVDNFTGNSTPVNLNGNTIYNFTVASDINSADANRFKIVFYPSVPLPVTFTSIKATQYNNDIAVEWKVENQINIKEYEVEKSLDGRNFTKVATQIATGTNGSGAIYKWLDVQVSSGDNFYRVKSIGFGGDVQYTMIVKVKMGKGTPAITVYPNPITEKLMTIQFTNMPKGSYDIRLLNTLGQPVYNHVFIHTGGSVTQTIKLENTLPAGNYYMEFIKPGSDIKRIKILIQ